MSELETALVRELSAAHAGWPAEHLIATTLRAWVANPVQVVDALGALVRGGTVAYDGETKLYRLAAAARERIAMADRYDATRAELSEPQANVRALLVLGASLVPPEVEQ